MEAAWPDRNHDLIRSYAETLFTFDARGRMVLSNEPVVSARRPAPLVYAALCTDGAGIRFGANLPDATVQRLAGLAERADVDGARIAHDISRELGKRSVSFTDGGLIYRFAGVGDMPRPAVPVVEVTAGNVVLAGATYPWLPVEYEQWAPCRAVIENDEIVSVCFSARLGETIAIAGVDTIPAARQRGYAAAATTAWAKAVVEGGRVPVYSTSSDNIASQAVARRLNLVEIGRDLSWD